MLSVITSHCGCGTYDNWGLRGAESYLRCVSGEYPACIRCVSGVQPNEVNRHSSALIPNNLRNWGVSADFLGKEGVFRGCV